MQVDRIVRDNALDILDKYNWIYTCTTYERWRNKSVYDEISRKKGLWVWWIGSIVDDHINDEEIMLDD